MIRQLRGLWVALAIVALGVSTSPAQTVSSPATVPLPTFVLGHGTPVKIDVADKFLRAEARHETAITGPAETPEAQNKAGRRAGRRSFAGLQASSCSGIGQPVEIATLAASLKCDPDLIFEYVYNNIEYEPLHGSNKGALGTLLDLSGDDTDQAQLFVALLEAAGIPSSQISYRYGYIRITGAQASSWLGVKNDASAIKSAFVNGGIPEEYAVANPDGTLNRIDVAQTWVQVQIDGINYQFDPSFKMHTVSTGLNNLGSVLGYSQSTFLADAGGAIDSTGISNINRTNVRNDLVRYGNNLINYIKGSNSALAVRDVVGGEIIQNLTGSPIRQTTLPMRAPSQPPGFPQNWGATVPNAYRTCFTISMPGVGNQYCSTATSQNIVLYADETYGHRITIFSTGANCAPGGSCTPVLLIDGAPPPNGQNTGTTVSFGAAWGVNVAITHPYTGSLRTSANQTKTLSIAAGGSYLVGAAWGRVGQGMIEKHRKLLAEAVAAGNADTSEAVLGESLSIISYSWLAELSSTMDLSDAIAKVTTQYHHGLGIVAQAVVQNSNSQGPYVDLPMNFVTIEAQTTYSGSGLPPDVVKSFYNVSGISSSLESAVLEQTQALISGMEAASTVRLVDMNAATGAKTYFADGTTSAGVSTYFNIIRPNLTSYRSTDLGNIDKAISTNGLSTGSPTGNQVLIPDDGSIAVGSVPWTGAGYTVSYQNATTGAMAITQRISGGLSGGFSGNNVPPATVVTSTQTQTIPPSGNPAIPSGIFSNPTTNFNWKTDEPIDAITGAYLYSHSDLVTGGGNFPYALSFTRNYTSASNTTDIGMGNGWANSYNISVSRSSDPYIGLGQGPAVSAAAVIAAMYVSQDLFGGTFDAQHMTLAWVVDRWLTDQITNNAAMVTGSTTREEFTLLPHNDGSTSGTYGPPFDSSATLTGSAPDSFGNFTVFTYRNKDQSLLTFNTLNADLIGRIASWTMPYGVAINFAYGYTYDGTDYLSRISNNLGRSLTLSYNGAHLSSVTDDTGRSVSYGYDSNNNLVSYTDPLNLKTNFAYDGAASHLTQIFYPSNPANPFVTNVYDALGRVNRQANANGDVTNYYFAGSRTEIVDAAGDRNITYQTPRGHVLKNDWVLSSSYGDVFNDTAQQDGVVNVTAHQYDGLDRLSLTTAPEGGTTGYTYSPDLLNNVIQITRTPKPGSPLAALTTHYAYDSVYNKPTLITDPRGLMHQMSYDPATGNLIYSIADAGVGHFNARTMFTYNSVGQVLAQTNPLGVVTAYTYDASGNQTTVTRDVGGLNRLTQFGYDGLGNATSVIDPNNNTTTSTYDADRRLTSVTTPSIPSAPGGLVTAYTYDADGRVLQTQQSNSGTALRATHTSYTPSGKTATTTDANGNVTRYAYDTVDRLSQVTDPAYRVTAYAYDAMSRPVSVSNPAVQSTPLVAKAYTPDGQLSSLTDANGHATSFAYDGLDRLSVTTFPDSTSDTETLSYDADSNIVARLTRGGNTIAYAYDTLNRLCSKTIAATPVACGGSSGNPTTAYAYDLAGRTTGVSDNSAAIPVPSGTSASFVTNLTYDAWNDPVTVAWSPAPAQTTPTAASVTFDHSYDATNRRVGQSVTDASWWAVPSAASATAYTANALNQYTAVGTVTPAYDGNGNLAFDGTDRYCYDAENRLVSVLSAGTCAAPTATVAAYAYDGQGRRKEKVVGSTSTVFVTDADNREVLEYDGATGAVQAWYAYGLGSNDVLNAMDVTSGTRQTLIPDIQGSIIATLDSSGTLTKAAYHPYGESPATTGSFRYAAMRIDPELGGLYYDRARMYSPVLGRFLQPDPIGYAGGINLYGYAANDPLNLTDENGLCYPLCTVVAGAAIGVATAYFADPKHFTLETALAGAGVGAAAGLVPVVAASYGVEAGTTAAVINVGANFAAGAGGAAIGQVANGQQINVGKDILLGSAAAAGPLVSGETAVTFLGTNLSKVGEAYLGTYLSATSQLVTTPLSYQINQVIPDQSAEIPTSNSNSVYTSDLQTFHFK